MSKVIIAAATRTPMGSFQGSLSDLQAPDLGAVVIRRVVEQTQLPVDDIDEVIMGCVLPAGLKQGPARQAMRKAGLPDHVGATTINKVCGSGMKAAMFAADAIQAGSISIAVVGGMESMTNAPYLLPKARSGYRMGHGQVLDHMFLDGLEDAYTGRAMGSYAQEMADQKNYTREAMDAFAIRSLTRAQTAIAEGYFDAEITPVTVQTRKGDITTVHDENPGNAKIDKIPSLKPAFAKDGTVTAANSSSISDGASALLIMSEQEAKTRQLPQLAEIKGYVSNSQRPEEFTIAPVGAIEKLLKKSVGRLRKSTFGRSMKLLRWSPWQPLMPLRLILKKSIFMVVPAPWGIHLDLPAHVLL